VTMYYCLSRCCRVRHSRNGGEGGGGGEGGTYEGYIVYYKQGYYCDREEFKISMCFSLFVHIIFKWAKPIPRPNQKPTRNTLIPITVAPANNPSVSTSPKSSDKCTATSQSPKKPCAS
jgi:hypothetical protein